MSNYAVKWPFLINSLLYTARELNESGNLVLGRLAAVGTLKKIVH